MEIIFNAIKNFSVLTVFLRIFAAALMGGLIGSERGRHGRAAGLRTHILVCIGAAMTSLTSVYLSETLGYTGDMARLSAQVISGIGFLGAGTILIRNSSVITGLTTAAGMWATAAIGVAVGYGFYSAAIIATFACIFCVTVLSRTERKRKSTANVYIELTDIADTEQIINTICGLDSTVLSYDIIPPKSGHSGNVGIAFILGNRNYFSELKKAVCENGSVAMVLSDINT